jgi:hypothetical protein
LASTMSMALLATPIGVLNCLACRGCLLDRGWNSIGGNRLQSSDGYDAFTRNLMVESSSPRRIYILSTSNIDHTRDR